MSAKDASHVRAKDATVAAALRGLVASETRIALLVSTALIGAGVAFGLAFFLQPADRTFAGVLPASRFCWGCWRRGGRPTGSLLSEPPGTWSPAR